MVNQDADDVLIMRLGITESILFIKTYIFILYRKIIILNTIFHEAYCAPRLSNIHHSNIHQCALYLPYEG